MPTYEYRCDGCGHEMEAFQSMKANPLKKCPECGTMKLVRLIGTGAAVLFKGSGFWQTDYRSESYKKEAAKDKPAESTKSEKSEGKPESKSEPKKTDGAAAKADKPKAQSK